MEYLMEGPETTSSVPLMWSLIEAHIRKLSLESALTGFFFKCSYSMVGSLESTKIEWCLFGDISVLLEMCSGLPAPEQNAKHCVLIC